MKKVISKKRFTLVELLVSLGIFSILLVLFMQFFSGMRLSWTNSEKRSEISSSVRLTMDMLSTLLSATYYSTASLYSGAEGQFPFQISNVAGRPGKMYFAVKTNMDLPGSSPIRFIGVQVPNASETFGVTGNGLYRLYLTVLSNDSSSGNGDVYPRYFPEFLDGSTPPNELSATAALGHLRTNLNNKLSGTSNHKIELLRNVTGFRITSYDYDGAPLPLTTVGTENVVFCVPGAVEITISVLKDEDFTAWVNMKGGIAAAESSDARAFRIEKQLTFTRRIHIGDRWKMEAEYDRY